MAKLEQTLKKWKDLGMSDLAIRFEIMKSNELLLDYLEKYPKTDMDAWADQLEDMAILVEKGYAHQDKIFAINRVVDSKVLAFYPLVGEILLKNRNETMRANAARYFGSSQFVLAPHERYTKAEIDNIKDSMVNTLIKALKKERHVYPLEKIILAIGKFPGDVATDALLRLLKYEGEDSWRIKSTAVQALGNYTDELPEGLDNLAKKLTDLATEEGLPEDLYGISNEDWEAAEDALEMPYISPFWNYDAIDRGDLVPVLIRLLDPKEDMEVIVLSLNLLEEMRDKRAIPALKAGIYHYRENGPEDWPEMVEAFQRTLDRTMGR